MQTGSDRGRPSGASLALVVLAAASGLFLAWHIAAAILLIFAGLLFGVVLDAFARGLALVLPVGRPWRVGLVCLLLAVVLAAVVAWGGYSLAQQASNLIGLLEEQLRVLRGQLESLGIGPRTLSGGEAGTLRELLLPDPRILSGHAQSAFGTALGLVGNAIVVAFIGLFVAVSPASYRRRLVPRAKRHRAGEVVDNMAESLRWWVGGQLVTMALVAVTMWGALALIGLPGAFLLGLQAGAVNFIPYLGPIVGGLPILLAAMPHGASMILWAMALYIVIQTIEGYLLAPMIQKRAVDLAPALTLSALVIGGALFGVMGIALATPILAVIRVAVLRLYVEDWLGDAPASQQR